MDGDEDSQKILKGQKPTYYLLSVPSKIRFAPKFSVDLAGGMFNEEGERQKSTDTFSLTQESKQQST